MKPCLLNQFLAGHTITTTARPVLYTSTANTSPSHSSSPPFIQRQPRDIAHTESTSGRRGKTEENECLNLRSQRVREKQRSRGTLKRTSMKERAPIPAAPPHFLPFTLHCRNKSPGSSLQFVAPLWTAFISAHGLALHRRACNFLVTARRYGRGDHRDAGLEWLYVWSTENIVGIGCLSSAGWNVSAIYGPWRDNICKRNWKDITHEAFGIFVQYIRKCSSIYIKVLCIIFGWIFSKLQKNDVQMIQLNLNIAFLYVFEILLIRK